MADDIKAPAPTHRRYLWVLLGIAILIPSVFFVWRYWPIPNSERRAFWPGAYTLTKPDGPSILLAGAVGSGGFPWQKSETETNPFANLSGAFKSADLALAGYTAYAPPTFWKRWFRRGRSYGLIEPNPQTAKLMHDAGLSHLLLLPPENGAPDPRQILKEAGLAVVRPETHWRKARPVIVKAGGINIALLACRQNIYTDRPSYKAADDALVVDWERAVSEAKRTVDANGRLIVFLPPRIPEATPATTPKNGADIAPSNPATALPSSNYDRLADPDDQLIARRAIDLGADAVVGLNGGAAGEVEEYKHGIIAYSLGGLLPPAFQPGVMTEASGLILRLIFPAGQKLRYEAIPVSFDDRFYPVFGPPGQLEGLAPRAVSTPAAEHLYDHLIEAQAVFQDASGKEYTVAEWSSAVQAERFLHEGWTVEQGYAAVGGAMSQGHYHKSIVIRPNKAGRIQVTFPNELIGEKLELTYGLVDASSEYKRRSPQNLTIIVGSLPPWKEPVENISGWRTDKINTDALAGTKQNIKIEVEAPDPSTFALAVDPIVIRGAATIQKLETQPYAFRDHIAEAVVTVVDADGKVKTCTGPDEAYRRLRGGKSRKVEENGPLGEGFIYRRWVCGDIPWDCVGLTFQRSAKELRPMIWLHPLQDAERRLTYGPLPLRSVIEGHAGFTDLGLKGKAQPVEFSILAGGREIFKQTVPNKPGWHPFRAAIPADLHGSASEIVFMVTTKKDTWGHFCFNAQMK